MKCQVRLFARARELAGKDWVEVDLPSGSRVVELRRALGEVCPALGVLLASSALAVDGDFAREEQSLSEASEIALLPPVSGG